MSGTLLARRHMAYRPGSDAVLLSRWDFTSGGRQVHATWDHLRDIFELEIRDQNGQLETRSMDLIKFLRSFPAQVTNTRLYLDAWVIDFGGGKHVLVKVVPGKPELRLGFFSDDLNHAFYEEQCSWHDFLKSYPVQKEELLRRVPWAAAALQASVSVPEPVEENPSAIARPIVPEKRLAKFKNPLRMHDGTNYPGLHPREVIAIRADDPDLLEFTDRERSQMAGQRKKDGTILPLQDRMQEMLRASRHVRRAMPNVVADSQKQWELWAERFKNQKLVLGLFIRHKTGCCRHMTALLQVTLQPEGLRQINWQDAGYVDCCLRENGYMTQPCRGTFFKGVDETGGRHAWLRVLLDDTWYILDPTQALFVREDLAKQGVELYWDAKRGHYLFQDMLGTAGKAEKRWVRYAPEASIEMEEPVEDLANADLATVRDPGKTRYTLSGPL